MLRFVMAAIAVAALTSFGPARADSMWDVENARANARAGGPISGYDAELLERWGCLSGTRSAFCRRLARGGRAPYRSRRKRVRR
jgi:hypothetical protein